MSILPQSCEGIWEDGVLWKAGDKSSEHVDLIRGRGDVLLWESRMADERVGNGREWKEWW